jgi:putative hydrolases of HD superfamily
MTRAQLDEGSMQPNELDGVLTFLRTTERLKTALRSGWTSTGQAESVAEHTWRLCLMAMVLYDGVPGIDLARLLKMCLIHDLGEALGGDIPAPSQIPGAPKADQERTDLLQLVSPLPTTLQEHIVELWDEYESAGTPEAMVAKGLDKLETILQHTQGKNPDNFDYSFNLAYGQRFTNADPVMAALRTRLDQETARLAHEAEGSR